MGVFHIQPEFFFGNAKDRVLFKKSFHEFHRDMYFKFKGHKYAGKNLLSISPFHNVPYTILTFFLVNQCDENCI